jgi:5,5'-dehydrodivanillate O-demethylase
MTKDENEFLTRVGPSTPSGELLRRYWHPVAAACELTPEKPIKRVTILGEKLVVFRMPAEAGQSEARYGLLAENCQHRLASLFFGRVDEHGIRCPYHGWKFDLQGRCIEQPAEPPDSNYKDKIQQPAYVVEKLAGLLFAYMGPLPAPVLPRWDVLAREDGRRWGVIESVIDCNWLQAMENSVDPAHLHWLHGSLGSEKSPVGEERFIALGIQAQYREKHEFIRFDYGIQKQRITQGRNPGDPPLVEQHPLVFPTALRLVISRSALSVRGSKNSAEAAQLTEEENKLGYLHNMQLRVPIDDTHTRVYHVNFLPSKTAVTPAEQDIVYEPCALKNEAGEYDMNIVTAQDSLAWESQGAITDRTKEHLGTTDRGVVMLRRLLKEQIEIVQRGGDPMGVVRDPAKNQVIHLEVFHQAFGLQDKTKQQAQDPAPAPAR